MYGVSKSAILNITETLREDLAETPIGVSCLCPGMLNTKIVAAQRNRPESMGPKAHEPFGSEPVSFGVDPSHCGRRVREAILVERALRVRRHPEGPGGRPQGGPVPRAQALVDAIDAGVVDEEPIATARARPRRVVWRSYQRRERRRSGGQTNAAGAPTAS